MIHRTVSLLLTLTLVSASPSVLAQTPGQTEKAGSARQSGRQAAVGQAGAQRINFGPAAGKEAVRWEPWSAMRMAAGSVLGWKIGINSDSIPHITIATALVDADALKLSNIEASSEQKFSELVPKNFDYNLQPGEMQAVKDRLFALNIRVVAYRVPTIGPDEASSRKVFEFAKAFRVETIVIERMPDDLAILDKLANEYNINVAICGNLKAALAAVQDHSKRLGVCGDTGIWLNAGVRPLDALAEAKDRLLVVGLRDRSAVGSAGHNVALGSGVADVAKLLNEMYQQQIKPSLITVDPVEATGSMADLSRSLDNFENALRPVMADKVDGISRTTASRIAPGMVTPDEKEKIDAALPTEASAKPKKPRKLLVLDLNIAYGGHRSIPAENYAIEKMGKTTGAYETIFSDDLDNLKYPKIKDYDAIMLNNTVGMIFVDPAVREGLVRFVREGGGLGGNHSTSHASMDWPELHEMLGVTRGVHRESNEEFWVKIDDPKSPLTAPFHGQDFKYADEFFRFVGPLYSRENLHVLMSMDVAKTDMNQGTPFMPGVLSRPDEDYAVSWIRSYGKGRVFFCILGHNPTLFESPDLAKYMLNGIQYMLGDMDADATPSAKLTAKR